MKRLLTLISSLFICVTINAQFYQAGDEPASLRWSQMTSENFRIIYPRGMDSLAQIFDSELELWRIPIGNSIGFTPNQQYHKPLQVILHPMNATANGFVSWAPRRMELYAVPDAYDPESLIWSRELAIHEGRHVAQMQFGRYKGFRFMSRLLGEMWTGAMCAVYTGPAFLEGDAVTAETALTDMGRGRSADFLEYNMVAFDKGDYRDWYRWRYGSIRTYTPDHYRAGYLAIAGMRSFYDCPLFTNYYYERIFNRRFGYPFFNFQKSVKELSGKRLRDAWPEIAENFAKEWAANAEQRGPFMQTVPRIDRPDSYKEYKGATSDGKNIFAIQSGLKSSRYLVRICPDKKVAERIRPFAAHTSELMWSEPMQRIYWSETIPDPRWGLRESSRIFWISSDGSKHGELTREGRLFNPAPHPSKEVLAVTNYPVEGKSGILVLDARNGKVLQRYPAPDSLQLVESAWTSYGLMASAISSEGFGIYNVTNGYSTVIPAQHRKIKQLRSFEGRLQFLCDRSGVHELYTFDGETVHQLTRTRYGISDVVYLNGDSGLNFFELSPEGRLPVHANQSIDVPVDFAEHWDAPTPTKLSAQESELAAAAGNTGAVSETIQISKYSKATHLVRLHSWAPIYFDYDRIKSVSADQMYYLATPGAMLLFQGNHGMAGSLGYSWNGQRSSYHARFEYSGLYPVLEGNIDVNDDAIKRYTLVKFIYPSEGIQTMSAFASYHNKPSVSGTLKAYIPWTFSRGGWSKGIIPQAKFSFSNDVFNTSYVENKAYDVLGEDYRNYSMTGYVPGHKEFMSKLSLSLRGYMMLSTPTAALYPRRGIGGELGYGVRPGLTDIFNSNGYAYVYGYLPGFTEGHSLRLSCLTQIQLNGRKSHFRESLVSVIPAGLGEESSLESMIDRSYPTHTLFGARYAFAAVPIDWSGLGPIAYVRNMEFNIFGEFACYGDGVPNLRNNLFGAGASVAFHLGNFLWLPFGTRIGVQYVRNGGSLLDGTEISKNHCGLIFSIDF